MRIPYEDLQRSWRDVYEGRMTTSEAARSFGISTSYYKLLISAHRQVKGVSELPYVARKPRAKNVSK